MIRAGRKESPTQDDGQHWNIWKAVKRMNIMPEADDQERPLQRQVLITLQVWANSWAGKPEWQSLLNKHSLLDELDEASFALQQLDQWRRSATCEDFIAVDVCGGKGIFCMLLQYVASLFWNNTSAETPALQSIVLLDKATDIDWQHLQTSTQKSEVKLVPIAIWSNTNLRDLDLVLPRFNELSQPLALTGIHLCKLLSPTMIGLANMLGPQCRYIALAPCCMPRAVRGAQGQQLSIRKYEPAVHRQQRLEQIERIEANLRRNRHLGRCFICTSSNHWSKHCPRLPIDPAEQERILQEALAATPCWKCGEVGHFKSECCNSKMSRIEPPLQYVDVSRILQHSNWMQVYCHCLAGSLQNFVYKVEDANFALRHTNNCTNDTNWNSQRKSHFIVAWRT